jgi:acetyl esterase/lipase
MTPDITRTNAKQICSNASIYNADGSKRFIMGGSAGGNLTAAVALKYASNPELRASGLIISCASTCHRDSFPGEYKRRWTPEKYADAPMIGRDIVDWAFGRDLLTYVPIKLRRVV